MRQTLIENKKDHHRFIIISSGNHTHKLYRVFGGRLGKLRGCIEQLEILKKRIEDKKNKEKPDHPGLEESPLAEWNPEVEGVGVQTSDASLPPCTCRVPSPTPVSSAGRMFDMQDLIPIKQNLDAIRKDCFYDGGIEFDRFKVIGQESDYTINEAPKEDFKKTRLYEIKRILKQHPSLCEIFQANTRC